MPKKKGKSKKGKGKKGKSKKETKTSEAPKDPMTPTFIPPPPLPREKVLNQQHHVFFCVDFKSVLKKKKKLTRPRFILRD